MRVVPRPKNQSKSGLPRDTGCMAKPRPEKKREPAEPTVLPTELQVGDRITDETGEWEVIRQPYTTAEGRIVHARVQRIDQPASWEIRNWDAFKRISVKRTTAEEGT